MPASRAPLFATAVTSAVLLVALSGCSLSPSSTGGSAAPGSAASTAQGGTSTSKDIDACSLVSVADVSTLSGQPFTGSTSATIATGQDQCAYQSGRGILNVVVYQPSSGVTWDTMSKALAYLGTPAPVSGIGDKAMEAGIEVDAQVGARLVAVQGTNFDLTSTEAVTKAVVAALGK